MNWIIGLCCGLLTITAIGWAANPVDSSAQKKVDELVMLRLEKSGSDSTRIAFDDLPGIPGNVAIASAHDPVQKFKLHSYLTFFEGRYWLMWSEGFDEDQPSQQVKYAVSDDGLHWGAAVSLSEKDASVGWVARGFWVESGQLYALAATFSKAHGFVPGSIINLYRFPWQAKLSKWGGPQLMIENGINNYPPEMNVAGNWQMVLRDVSMNTSLAVASAGEPVHWLRSDIGPRSFGGCGSTNEPILQSLPGGIDRVLFRCDGDPSFRIYRADSYNGRHKWTPARRTNFPNTNSKFYLMKASAGTWILIGNANRNAGRRRLYLATSRDGQTFDRLVSLPTTSLVRSSTVQYPHAIEHEGKILITYSRNKSQIEVLAIDLENIADIPTADTYPFFLKLNYWWSLLITQVNLIKNFAETGPYR